MVELTIQDFRDVLRVNNCAAEFSTVNQLRTEVLHLLRKTLKAEKGNFFLLPGTKPQADFYRVISLGVEERAVRLYRRYYYQLDPFAMTVGPSDPTVVTTDDVVIFKNFVRTEYYNDFLKPQSIHHQLTFYLKNKHRLLGVVTLFRSRKAIHFSSLDKAKANLMLPSIAGSLEKTINSDKLLKYEYLIDAIIPDLPYKGVIVLDWSLFPLYYNENACSILSRLKLTEKSEVSGLGAIPKILIKRCKELIDQGGDHKVPKPTQQVFPLKSPDTGQKVTILIRRITRQGNPCILIGLEPKEHILCLTQSLYKKGLSRRELDVIFLAAKGLRNLEIAEKLCLSHYTVENHLKSIYRKMEVRNRTSLLNRVIQHSSSQVRITSLSPP